MNNEYLLWNVYVNIESMDRLDKNFYTLHYKYKRLIYTSEKSKSDFRNNKSFKLLLEELNKAYEKIHDCTNEVKNEFGEYDYPRIAYKVKFEKISGKNITKKYASVSGTNSCRKIGIENLFDFATLYVNGDVKSKKNKSNEYIDHLTSELSIKDVILFFKNNQNTLKKCCNLEMCFDAINKLSDFPIDSISELDFNYLIGKEDFEVIQKNFIEKSKENSKNPVETNI